MYAVGRLGSYISRGVYTVSGPFHPFGGAVDIIVVEQPDGSFKSSPWYVRFGKFQGVLKTKEKVVSIGVNDVEANFHMFLDHKGEAYFLREVDGEEGESEAVSFPFSSGDETDEPSSGNRRPMKSKSCNYDAGKSNSVSQVDVSNGKIVARTTSRRSRIFGLVFGQRSTKEDGHQEGVDGAGVVRLDSLERAEIAADLLEVKWSTNLASSRVNNNASRVSSTNDALDNKGTSTNDVLDNKGSEEDTQINDEENQVQSSLHNKDEKNNDEEKEFHSSVHEKEENNTGHQALLDETDDCKKQNVSCSHSGQENLQCSVEEASMQVSCVSTQKQIVETSAMSEGFIQDKCEEIADISVTTDDHSVRNSGHDEIESGAVSGTSGPDLQCGCKLDTSIDKQFDEEVADNESNSVAPTCGISNENVADSLRSLVYCKTSESSVITFDGSSEQTHQTLCLSSIGDGKVHVDAETLVTTTELVPEVILLKEAEAVEFDSEGALTSSESYLEMISVDPVIGLEEMKSHSIDTTSTVSDLGDRVDNEKITEDVLYPFSESVDDSRNLYADNSDPKRSINSLELESYSEMVSVDPVTGLDEMKSHSIDISSTVSDLDDQVDDEKITKDVPRPFSESADDSRNLYADNSNPKRSINPSRLESYSEMVSVDPVIGLEEIESHGIGTTSKASDLGVLAEDEKNARDVLHPSSEPIDDSQNFYGGNDPRRTVSPSETSEDEQFLFSDLDESKLQEPDSVNKDLHPSVCTESEEINGLCDVNNESLLIPDKFVQEKEISVENSRIVSNPISISRNHRVASEKNGWQVESLPNMWSPIAKFDANSNRPLSHSLDSNSETLNWTSIRNDDSSCIRSDADADKEQPIKHERSSSEESETSRKLKTALYNPAVEISLCKHLLYEGMGAEAACQAFDAEKLDSEKFRSLGLAVLKNDRLVVRMGGRYFPWDAAAPILLGIVAFGSEEIFEPKGTILVDRVEKSIEGDPSKAIMTRSGSWRLWPFSLKRSRSRKAVQPAPADTEGLDAENPEEDTVASDDDKNLLKPKQVKKIRALTPTSEQLASLNLKDGMNHVTFTFSTAMLGKQQVDARIYLWKWNTRIVISDVDGTITKSDVLGQFMPLVGIDWSQTGVAHLFSAIKENGYELLFLSARAISQAYITRQFLVNLKQDGKALPDGPIFISPDGLFPSLYREVIRRAPHEFKIACLEEIKALFPSDCNPFYAGFGNRDTDEISYFKVGIPKGKIFIINPKGEVVVNRRVDTKSYTSLHALVHGMFPPTASTEQEDFNSWNFWKLPPPLIDI